MGAGCLLACLRFRELALGGVGGHPLCFLSPWQPWEASLRRLSWASSVSPHSWGCPKQNYTFNGSSSEINW